VIPYHDENKTARPTPVTWLIIGANVVVWLVIQGAGTFPALPKSVCELGLVAGELTGALAPGTAIEIGEGLTCVVEGSAKFSHILTSMFLHGSWLHLLGNMWFLYLFGNNIEDSMGHLRFALFYVLTGVVAALAQVMLDPAAATPMVGASGAISGVMGGYLVLYPRVRIFTFVPIGFFFMSFKLPAWTMLIYWFVLQALGGLTALSGAKAGGVAFAAHVGGFIAGMLLVKLFAEREMVRAHSARPYRPTDFRRAA
jgi:membrane associated rhomboid family serine protease